MRWGPTRCLQISCNVTPLNRAQEVDIPLVECARKPGGDTRPLLEYANEIASTIQCDKRCLVIGFPVRGFIQDTNSWSLSLNSLVLSV